MRTVGLFVLLLGSAAEANTTVTMCQVDHPNLTNPNCSGNSKYRYDQAMNIYEPTGPAKNLLIVLFHGHPGSPSGFDAFQQYAASLGYHSISIDFDYGFDPTGDTDMQSCPNYNPSVAKSNRPREVCGCYTECYGRLHDMVIEGNNYSGIPPSHYDVKTRLTNVINYLKGTWSQYVVGGDIQWGQIVPVGLSRGTSLATHLARHHAVNRVLWFSGPHDQLMSSDLTPADLITTVGTDINNPPAYCFGPSQGATSFCSGSATAPNYVSDNSWLTPGATPWPTERWRMYAFTQEADEVAPNLDANWGYGTEVNLNALTLQTYGTGRTYVGNYYTGELPGWNSGNAHFLSPGPSVGPNFTIIPGDLCHNSDNPHVSALMGTCCLLGANSCAQSALRQNVWQYMLTH
jgi:pimeloyl-ACP methyl ester carboxylesterase